MTTSTPLPLSVRALARSACLASGVFLAGCSIDRHTVIASTGTMLGVELTQDQATQSPRIKAGYNRAEVALVPSNRSTQEDPGSRLRGMLCPECAKGNPAQCTTPAACKAVRECTLDGGAADTAEVLMEIRMQGGILFSGIHDAGIYQRLAVGKTAVQQPGAALMFARDQAGSIDGTASTAVRDAVSAAEKQRMAWALEEVKKQKIWVQKALDDGFSKQTTQERKEYFKVVLGMSDNDARDLSDERLGDREKMRKLLESTEWYPKLKKHFAPDAE